MRRSLSLIAVVLSASLAFTACTDDSKGKDSTTTTEKSSTKKTTTTEKQQAPGSDADSQTLIDYLADGDTKLIDADEAKCVAKESKGLSADAYDVARKKGKLDFTKFSQADSDELVAALDTCIDFQALLTDFGSQMTSEAGLTLKPEEASCAAALFAKGYTTAGAFIRDTTALADSEAGSKLFDALGPCMSTESAVAFMKTILSQQELPAGVADCIAAGVVAKLGTAGTLQGFADAAKSNTGPLQGAMTEAMSGCGLAVPSGATPPAAPTTTAG